MVPELTEAEYAALKAAIRESGRILVAVVVISDGEVIDGKGRLRAAEELKITNFERVVVDGLDAEARGLPAGVATPPALAPDADLATASRHDPGIRAGSPRPARNPPTRRGDIPGKGGAGH